MMKKMLYACVMAVVLSCSFVTGAGGIKITAQAAQSGSLGILDEWIQKEAPDFYGGVRYISSTDKYYVYLKDNTEQNQKIVVDGIPANIKVVFITCEYSRSELLEVQNELEQEIGSYTGIQTYGIGTADLETGRCEPRLTVGILKDSYSVTAKKLEEKYGDKIYAVQSGEIVAGPEIIKVKVTTAKIQNNKVVLKWEKNANASKYRVVIKGSNGKKLVDKTTTKTSVSYKVKNLKKYIVKIKAYDKNTGKWQKYTVKTLKRN